MLSEEEYVFIVKELDDLGAPDKPLWERVEWAGRKIRRLELEAQDRPALKTDSVPISTERCNGPLTLESEPGDPLWIFKCSKCGGTTSAYKHLARCDRPAI